MRNNVSQLLHLTLFFSFLLSGVDCGKTVQPPDEVFVTSDRVLTDGEQPAVSPDGRKIAFTRDGDIFVCDTNGTNIVQLTSGASIDVMPRWHPDGMSVGFVRSDASIANKGLLVSVPATGGVASQLVFGQFVGDSLIQINTFYGGIGMPIWDWSPNAQYVVMLQQLSYRTYISVFIVSSNQESFSQEIFNPATAIVSNGSCFSWSTEQEIAFVGQNSVRRRNPFLMNLSTRILLKDTSHIDSYTVSKSPLGRIFAYFSAGKIVLTDFQTTLAEYPVDGGGFGLKWSPDGSRIAFEASEYFSGPYGYRESQIGVYDINHGKQYLLTSKGDIDRVNYFFDWGRGSNSIYFERYKKICVCNFRIMD